MAGKRGLVMGIANRQSIAWGVAKAAREAGARLALSHQGGPLERRAAPLAEELEAEIVATCDVMREESLDALFAEIASKWGGLDFLVHSIAFSDREQLAGRFADTTLENFQLTMQASCWSFVSAARRAEALMEDGGSMLAMTFLGSQRAAPNYNVMGVAKAALEASTRYLANDFGPRGIRVNAVSAGPIRTLAAAGGVSGFREMLRAHAGGSPLRRNVDIDDVGRAALFLLSPLSSGTTGDILYVDAGAHAMIGMTPTDEDGGSAA